MSGRDRNNNNQNNSDGLDCRGEVKVRFRDLYAACGHLRSGPGQPGGLRNAARDRNTRIRIDAGSRIELLTKQLLSAATPDVTLRFIKSKIVAVTFSDRYN
ncbi:hypothetical protein [Bradyrhizobium sp. RT9a]|uniref:hypothetical protein n=1 Tax=Bradyrhizobium sp. RT9a TaxID=3156384 RepID=UPI00339562D3